MYRELLPTTRALFPQRGQNSQPKRVRQPMLLARTVRLLPINSSHNRRSTIHAKNLSIRLRNPRTHKLQCKRRDRHMIRAHTLPTRHTPSPSRQPFLLRKISDLVQRNHQTLRINPRMPRILLRIRNTLPHKRRHCTQLNLPNSPTILHSTRHIINRFSIMITHTHQHKLNSTRDSQLSQIRAIHQSLNPRMSPNHRHRCSRRRRRSRRPLRRSSPR